jgi:hypothetical protein
MLLIAAIMLHTYASTPQSAAIGAMSVDPKHPPVVERANVVGAYAAVLAKGGKMEGDPVTFPILVERFSFGWQPVDALNFYCNLEAHHLGQSTDDALMRGMPRPKDDRPCKGTLLTDAGPSDDVDAVRRMMHGPVIPYVVVSDNWAVGEWYGGGGGESLFQKNAGHWHLVESESGAMGVNYMVKHGVPRSDWCKFGIYDAVCP